MKKNIVRYFSLMLVLAIVTPFLSGCKEDNKCRLVVKVVDVTNTSIVIPDAYIEISKDAGSINAEGKTDIKGEAYFTFDHEAILDINVGKTDDVGYTRYGKSTVRLIPGETVEKLVLLQQ